MQVLNRAVYVLVAAFLALGVLPGNVAAQDGYTISKILDSRDSENLDPFEFGCPAINDLGDVAVRVATVSGTQLILRFDTANQRKVIARTGPRFDFLGRNPSINNRGAVSFAANLQDGGEAILRRMAGSLTTIATTEPGQFNFFGFDTSVNNRGTVAFKAELDNFDEGLFTGLPLRTHYLASTSMFTGDDSGPSINDDGKIAFAESTDDGRQGIFRRDDRDEFTTIADDSGPIGFAFRPSLNALGVVAFQAFLDDGESAIFTGNGGPLATVVDTTGPFAFFDFAGPSLNDAGMVAFVATLDSGEQGIFVGPDPIADRVIGTGDALDGSTVINLVLCREGLNNAGQLVFLAQLEDGTTGVFRATP